MELSIHVFFQHLNHASVNIFHDLFFINECFHLNVSIYQINLNHKFVHIYQHLFFLVFFCYLQHPRNHMIHNQYHPHCHLNVFFYIFFISVFTLDSLLYLASIYFKVFVFLLSFCQCFHSLSIHMVGI